MLILGKGSPRQEGLSLSGRDDAGRKSRPEYRQTVKAPENMSAFQIFCTYVLRNKMRYVSLVDVFVYMVRFGMISWLPIYLLTVKHFSKEQMSVAFLFLNGPQSLPRYLPVGCQTNCLKGVVCHWR